MLYTVEDYILTDDDRLRLPIILSAYFEMDNMTGMAIFNQNKKIIALAVSETVYTGVTVRIAVNKENPDKLSDTDSKTENIIACLEEYYQKKRISEIKLIFYDNEKNVYDTVLSRNNYVKCKQNYEIAYHMKDLLESALFSKIKSYSEELLKVKTYDELDASQKMSLVFDFDIYNINETDKRLSRFFVLDNTVKGTLAVRIMPENIIAVDEINAVAQKETILAIPLMIMSGLDSGRALFGGDTAVSFLCKTSKQYSGLVNAFGQPGEYYTVTEFKKD